ELADRLNVTDKAVSKWETGKGFPDVKLMEPLAQALGVSLVELIQGARSQKDCLTMDEAGTLASQAMDQSQRITARRYLRLVRWMLIVTGVVIALRPLGFLGVLIRLGAVPSTGGLIGYADGPTAIMVCTACSWLSAWGWPLTMAIAAVTCLILAVKVWKLEQNLY
ncbi:MAG: helix-turn-helix transcriptional regulator, partial [Lawsonibacter sp.]|nr:helix-turn-helix transcriptional regulator [Lawsonibacter sp.]